uniref:ficolin-2-like n=1 Tax=Styela clava TaxID=7725 RepID=UPI0019394406|nr:ficolin-2-like [Styela clava]
MIVALVTFNIVMITQEIDFLTGRKLTCFIQMQDEIKLLRRQQTPQNNSSADQFSDKRMRNLDSLTKLTEQQAQLNYTVETILHLNRSQEQLSLSIIQESEAFHNKLNEQQIRLNQCIEITSSLNCSHQQLKIQELFPKDCTTVFRKNAKTQNNSGGVFDIYSESSDKPFEVYCDLATDGGGWTVFQRRMDGTEDFYRGWDEYANGFGEKDKEMWLGLETIHQLTKNRSYELRVDLGDFNGNTAYAKYGTFSIASASENYRLLVGEYNGTAGDSFTQHNNMQFSTKYSDNDGWSSDSCAKKYKGAWWYRNCYYSNLNGFYYQDGQTDVKSVNWYFFQKHQSLKFTEMKFRKKDSFLIN